MSSRKYGLELVKAGQQQEKEHRNEQGIEATEIRGFKTSNYGLFFIFLVTDFIL